MKSGSPPACCQGCSATITPASCPRAPLPFALPPPRSAFCLPGISRAVCFLCGPSPDAFSGPHALPPPRRVARPSAPPGVWRRPSAPLTQILGKGRAAPHAGVPRGAGGPHCPLYPPRVTPGTFSVTGVSGSGPCHRATSTEDKLSPAPVLAPSQPQSPPCPPHSDPRPGTSPWGDVPSCKGTPKDTDSAARRCWHRGAEVWPCLCRHPRGWRWFLFCF